MANIIEYATFVLDEALSSAIENFEKNVKGKFICITEKGIRIKIHNVSTGKYSQFNVVPKANKVSFENLNHSAVISFNNISKDNAKYALTYYKQIMTLKHASAIIVKLDSLELKKKYIEANDNLLNNRDYRNE